MRVVRLGIGALVFFVCSGCSGPAGPSWDWLEELRRADGSPVELGEPGDRPVLLVFFSSWSTPCRPLLEELPSLKQRTRVIAVLVDAHEPGGAEELAGPDGAIASDEKIVKRFGIELLPTVVLLDRSGTVVDRFEGYSPALRGRIEQRLEDISEE